MISYRIELSLPDNLASEAEKAGLLTPDAIKGLLRAEIRRRRVDEFFSAANALADLDIPPLTPDEIEAEIKAARESKGAYRADGT